MPTLPVTALAKSAVVEVPTDKLPLIETFPDVDKLPYTSSFAVGEVVDALNGNAAQGEVFRQLRIVHW